MLERKIAIELIDVQKAFGATVALAGANMAIRRGEIHALLGENGAGKSTTVKMLSGLILPNAGRIRVHESDVTLSSPRVAHNLGIATAFQEMTQMPDLTVEQNVLLPYQPTGFLGTISRKKSRRTVEEHFDRLGLSEIDPRAEVRSLDLASRQKVEIARAMLRKPNVLLLDEPTSALTGRDMEWLGGLMRNLQENGVTIIFITHRMMEVRQYCETLTILRNGRTVAASKVADISDEEIVTQIVGRSLAATFPAKPERREQSEHSALCAINVSLPPKVAGVSFRLEKGEILGLAGLQGMGQLEVLQLCFGDLIPESGWIEVSDRRVDLTYPSDAIGEHIGFGLVPEDRKTDALCLALDGQVNMTLPVLDRFTRRGLIQRGREQANANEILKLLQVPERALSEPVASFSGGNQQKIVLARWLLAGARVLLLYDPTRGVDVGTKHDIYKLMRRFVDDGGSILFYSTEIEELVGMCDRVGIMYKGMIRRVLVGSEISEAEIMKAVLGGFGG